MILTLNYGRVVGDVGHWRRCAARLGGAANRVARIGRGGRGGSRCAPPRGAPVLTARRTLFGRRGRTLRRPLGRRSRECAIGPSPWLRRHPRTHRTPPCPHRTPCSILEDIRVVVEERTDAGRMHTAYGAEKDARIATDAVAVLLDRVKQMQ